MFTTTKKDIGAALDLVGACIKSKATILSLSTILVEGDGDCLWLTGSDLDTTAIVSLDIKSEECAFCIPAAQFIKLVSLFGSNFSVEEAEHFIVVKHGKAIHRLPKFSRADYPQIQPVTGLSLSTGGAMFTRMLQAVERARETREDAKFPAMRGVLITVAAGTMSLVATDGVRLAAASIPLDGAMRAVLPGAAVPVFSRFADEASEIEIVPQEHQISVRSDKGIVSARQVIGAYPNWRQVIPETVKYEAEMDVQALALAMKRAGITSNGRDSNANPAQSLKFIFDSHELRVEARSAERGECEEYVDISCPGLDEPFSIGVGGRQLLDFIDVVQKGKIIIGLSTPETQLLLQPAYDFGFDFRYVAMPVRIGW